jgi:hypothetical protein
MSSKLLPNKSARQVESQGPPGSLVWRIVAYQREEALKRNDGKAAHGIFEELLR